jgi:hypothetical protein
MQGQRSVTLAHQVVVVKVQIQLLNYALCYLHLKWLLKMPVKIRLALLFHKPQTCFIATRGGALVVGLHSMLRDFWCLINFKRFDSRVFFIWLNGRDGFSNHLLKCWLRLKLNLRIPIGMESFLLRNKLNTYGRVHMMSLCISFLVNALFLRRLAFIFTQCVDRCTARFSWFVLSGQHVLYAHYLLIF